MKTDLSIRIGKVKFKNPILAASGTYGYANEFEKFYDVRQLGGIVTKTITLKPRLGNPPQRAHETSGGMLNAIGLQNVGIERFVSEKMPYLRKLKIPIIVSIMGYELHEFDELSKRLDAVRGIDGFELNLSCPNVKYKSKTKAVKMFAHDPTMTHDVVKTVRKNTKKLVIAKLGPDVSDVSALAMAAEKAGADAISLINTLRAMAIDYKTQQPVLKNVTGGLSGPCVKPVALRMVWEVYNSVKIPVIGMGGIASSEDVAEFMVAGAALVQVGTMNFVNPLICPEIIKGMQGIAKQCQLKKISALVGSLKV